MTPTRFQAGGRRHRKDQEPERGVDRPRSFRDDQRVGVRPQHQPLQVPDLGQITGPRRREDPLPQTPYVPLGRVPIDLRPAQKPVPLVRSPRSHRHRRAAWRPTCPSVPASMSTAPPQVHPTRVSSLSGPGTRRGYPAGYAGRSTEEPTTMSRFPAAFRPPAFASRVILRPPRNSVSLTVNLPD
jgi:hypothetical protein